jgi:predicted amidohydrolase
VTAVDGPGVILFLGGVPRPWTVALAQAAPVTAADPVGELAADVARIVADDPRVRMVVHPEIHLFGGADRVDDPNAWLRENAEPLDGPRVTALGRIAAEHRVWLVPGSVAERSADGRIFNTAVVLAPDGRLVAAYRKVFPWRPYEQWTPGADWVTFDVPDVGRFGLSICYDSWFPESTRQLAWLGAEVVLNVVKTIGADRAQELVLARANAIVNQVYFLSVNAAGPVGQGRSIHVDPDGDVLAEAADAAPAVTVLELDLDRVTQVRESGTAGLNRLWHQFRPDDAPIHLPAYDGTITPGRWTPSAPVDPSSA